MSYGKSTLLRRLVPKSYHFDGYNELNCPNTRDRPFFSEGSTRIGDYNLNTRFDSYGNLVLEYNSVCPYGKISFKPYFLHFEDFVKLLRKALEEESDFITFEIKTTYQDLDCRGCNQSNKDCKSILEKRPSITMAAVSFEVTDIKNALSVYFGINKLNEFQGGNTMKGNMKKFFGMNFEWGLSKDRNIASTLMGVAVKNPNDGNWYVFDSASSTRKNLANMKMGDFPVFLLPAQALEVGDLTKMEGKYYYVQEVKNKYLTLLGAADGIVRQMLPSESIIPGMNLYTKVVAFDTKTLVDPTSKDNMSGNILAAMCMMQWSKGESEFSLDNISDDSFNGLGSCLPVLMALNGGSNNLGGMFGGADGNGLNLPLLMMMGSGNGSDEANEMVQLMLLSQLLGGNNGSSMFGTAIPSIASTPSESTPANEDLICPNCKTKYSSADGVAFCSKCGTATIKISNGKNCVYCGATLKEGAAFCHACGKKVEIAGVCPACGEKNDPDSNFCVRCGNSLKEIVKPVPTEEKATPVAAAAPAEVKE